MLFMHPVDADHLNAQSLNTREIVLRLDPARFECSLFFTREPDPRLLNKIHLRLVRLPARFKTVDVLKEMLSGHDIIAYVDFSPASYLYLHLPRHFRKTTRTVMHIEGLTDLKGETGTLKFLFMGTASKCDFYTGITKRSAEHFKFVMHREIFAILPVGVDRNIFSPIKPKKQGSPTVLFVGTLIERKGLLLVLEAAARFPYANFRIIGPDRHGFEQVIRKRILELKLDNVSIEGAMPSEAIAQAMREGDIFLLPSRLEGLPKVTLEAAACGLPCIVFRDYETPSVIDGVSGFQVCTTDEMMEKLGLLLQNAQMREIMGAAGKRVAEQFDWDRVAQIWQDTYLKIAAKA